MVRAYRKPPLIEAVCDFRFSGSQPWDWTVPGLFYEQIRNDFPNKEQVNVVGTIIDPAQSKIVQQAQPKMQFVNENRTRAIQVAPDNLSLHQLHPYDGWECFKKSILKYLLTYRSIANPEGLTRVGLRYVNRLELPTIEIELNEYFRILPQVPPPIPQIFPSFLLNVEIPYNSPENRLRITFGTVIPENPSNNAYVLDFDIFTSDNAIPSMEEVSDWLDIAHDRIEVAFDAAFTGRTRHEIFEEVSNESG